MAHNKASCHFCPSTMADDVDDLRKMPADLLPTHIAACHIDLKKDPNDPPVEYSCDGNATGSEATCSPTDNFKTLAVNNFVRHMVKDHPDKAIPISTRYKAAISEFMAEFCSYMTDTTSSASAAEKRAEVFDMLTSAKHPLYTGSQFTFDVGTGIQATANMDRNPVVKLSDTVSQLSCGTSVPVNQNLIESTTRESTDHPTLEEVKSLETASGKHDSAPIPDNGRQTEHVTTDDAKPMKASPRRTLEAALAVSLGATSSSNLGATTTKSSDATPLITLQASFMAAISVIEEDIAEPLSVSSTDIPPQAEGTGKLTSPNRRHRRKKKTATWTIRRKRKSSGSATKPSQITKKSTNDTAGTPKQLRNKNLEKNAESSITIASPFILECKVCYKKISTPRQDSMYAFNHAAQHMAHPVFECRICHTKHRTHPAWGVHFAAKHKTEKSKAIGRRAYSKAYLIDNRKLHEKEISAAMKECFGM